ncbi:dTDP-4-dehydrorhamnose reductase [Mycobacterium kansasii]|uniref:dTDP-4-dehydrorhamnose reductase n=1 Tax=Mycobacterium kansasii TaxID=1768 RepID=A0A1V3XRF2_MYCKA|nr:dTDP-4-dehydrorhamnose reductase [Mycobacterium kansasii]
MSGRIVITGAGGQLGRVAAAQAARAGREVLAQTSSQWDITDPGAAGAIIQTGDVVLNCAAYTDVDAAESDEARAYAVNASGPEHLARACARVGARLIHVSTDYVFNGDFNGAQPHPYEPGDATAPRVCMPAASSPVNKRCWRRCRRPSWCAPRGYTPAGRHGLRGRHAPAGRR